MHLLLPLLPPPPLLLLPLLLLQLLPLVWSCSGPVALVTTSS
jgi:hypothetical protein